MIANRLLKSKSSCKLPIQRTESALLSHKIRNSWFKPNELQQTRRAFTNTTRQALEAAEARLEEAQASLDEALSVDETAVKAMVAALPRAIGKYRKALDRIEDTLSTRLEHSRELLRDLLGEISLRPNGHALEARMRLDWLSTLGKCHALETAKLKVMMVAEEAL